MQRAILGLGLFFLLISVTALWAQQPATAVSSANSMVPPLVSFGGVLNDVNGKPLTAVTGVTFALYKDAQGGMPLWMETQNVYPDKTGRYTVLLGSMSSTGLPSDLFVSGEARWLGAQVQGQSEQPRVSLLSVPYALKAGDAQTVGGLPPSAFVLAAPPPAGSPETSSATPTVQPLAIGTTPVTTAGGTANVLAKFDAKADVTNSQIFDNGTNVGIGTSAPAAKLDVKGTGAIRGLFSLPQILNATATGGYTSQPLKMTASVFNSTKGAAIAQNFQLQAEPVGNNSSGASGTLNLLYSTGTNNLAETGLRIAGNGQITFAPGQAFPGTGKGNGSVTSVGLTAPSTEFIVTGSPVTVSGTLGLGWLVAPDWNNTPNAIVKRDRSGYFSASTINADTSFNLGNNPFAYGSLMNNNVFLGFAGSTTTTGWYNTGTGVSALWQNTTGGGNTADGYWTLWQNTTGFNNTATGYEALNSNTTGSNNTATGASALQVNTVGDSNTASGSQALYSNDTGSGNTAIGMCAVCGNTTGESNTGVGMTALASNSTGTQNTSVGAFALGANTTGNYNTAIGALALSHNATGSSNTGLGYGAGPDQYSPPDLTNATAVGAYADVTQSNSLVLGGIAGLNGAPTSTRVGIGTTAPTNVFTIGQGAGHAIADGWDTYSSRRWKTNIHTLHGALRKVKQLRGVSYDLKDSDKHEIGVIAEEVGAVVPEVVRYEDNGTDARSVDYGRLTALLIEATKEQQQLIQQQQLAIERLKSQVKTIEAALKADGGSERKARIRKAQARQQ